MLTILFKILSILGIVLLILLGIALVVILLVLFFPISYKSAGKRTAEEFWITARVKWLFGLLRMNCDYPDPGKICVKFLFFTLYDSSVEKPEKTDRTSTETTGNEKTPASAEQTTEEHTLDRARHDAGGDVITKRKIPRHSRQRPQMLSLLRKGRIPESRNREHQSQREKLPGRLRIVCTHFLQESGTQSERFVIKSKIFWKTLHFTRTCGMTRIPRDF